MTASTKDLIAKLRDYSRSDTDALMDEAADVLERLTQPVGVAPVCYHSGLGETSFDILEADKYGWPPLYSAATVARLIAERDGFKHDAEVNNGNSIALADRVGTLQEQVKLLEGHKMLLRHALLSADERMNLDISRYGIGDEDYTAIRKALAATDPKDKP